MAVRRSTILSFKEAFTLEQLKAARDNAASDLASGVKITQVSFQDAGGTGVVISGDPADILEALQIALDEKISGQTIARAPLSSRINFNTRRCET